MAAVFIALVLSPPMRRPAPAAPPPTAAESPAPPPSAEAVSQSTPSLPEQEEPLTLTLSLSGRCDGAPAGAPRVSMSVSCGGEAGVAVAGRRGFGLLLSGGVLAPASAAYESVEVHEQRFPFALGVRAQRHVAAGWGVAADLAAAAVVFTVRGQRLDTTTDATRVDLGGHLAVVLFTPPWRRTGRAWAGFVAAHVDYFPRPYELEVHPLGVVGSLPGLRAGLSVGVAATFRRAPGR